MIVKSERIFLVFLRSAPASASASTWDSASITWLHHLRLGDGDLLGSHHPVVVQVQDLEKDCQQFRIPDDLLGENVDRNAQPEIRISGLPLSSQPKIYV